MNKIIYTNIISNMDYIKSIRPKLGHQKIILNCSGVIIVKDNKILLQRRKDNNMWGIIGGLLELNETFDEAAVRECKEETGLDIKLEALLGIFHNHDMEWSNGDKAHVIAACYLASIISGEIRIDEESYELKFFDINEIPYLFAEDHREAIKAYKEGIRLQLLNENKYRK